MSGPRLTEEQASLLLSEAAIDMIAPPGTAVAIRDDVGSALFDGGIGLWCYGVGEGATPEQVWGWLVENEIEPEPGGVYSPRDRYFEFGVPIAQPVVPDDEDEPSAYAYSESLDDDDDDDDDDDEEW